MCVCKTSNELILKMYFTFFLAALARAMFFIRCFDLFLFIFLLILLFIFLYKREKKQNSRLVRFGRWVGHTQCIWSSLLLSAVLSDYFDIWTDFMYIIIIFALFFIFILFCSVIVYMVAWPYCNTARDSDYFFVVVVVALKRAVGETTLHHIFQ